MKIGIYDESNIGSCPWPANPDGQYAKKFLSPIIKKGVAHFIDNIQTEMRVLIVDGVVLPITINDAQYENSFVCSPYGHYVAYASTVLGKLNNKLLRGTFKLFLKMYGSLMKLGKLNKVVTVNNWLFTTNPSPKINREMVLALNEFLKKKFPDHAIIFRAITNETCKEGYEALRNSGYRLIASRYMYLTDGTDESVFKTRIFKSDLKFLRESHFQLLESHEIKEEDIPNLHELYNALYIQKYSTLNPQFNQNFIRHVLKHQLLNVRAIKLEDHLEGVVGYHCQDGKMISPLFGYDPVKSEKKGVYRCLSTILMLESQKHQALFNQSAGGSFYKKIRRAYGDMEYTAAYHKHLPICRRFPWWFVEAALNTVGKRFMKKY